jgi:hypothetical protein
VADALMLSHCSPHLQMGRHPGRQSHLRWFDKCAWRLDNEPLVPGVGVRAMLVLPVIAVAIDEV